MLIGGNMVKEIENAAHHSSIWLNLVNFEVMK